jgi:hypothetical protein
MASITIHVPDQEALEYDLDAVEQLTFGRGPDNDVVIEHVSMSGSHAMIQNLGGTFQLIDLGSTNGTYINGAPVTEAVLESGAQIQFGSVEAVFVDGEIVAGAADAEAPAGEESAGAGASHPMHAAEIAEVSNRPADFKDLSPIEKVEKKNVLAQVAMLVGIVAILAAITLIAISFTMQAA